MEELFHKSTSHEMKVMQLAADPLALSFVTFTLSNYFFFPLNSKRIGVLNYLRGK